MAEADHVNSDGALDKVQVVILNRKIHQAIGLITIFLPLLYTYLSFKDIPLDDLARSLSTVSAATVIWKITLAVYFFLWVFGTKGDADDQELVYRNVPNKGQLTLNSIGVIVGICVLAAILLWSPNFELFIVALSVFFIFNIFAWQYLIRKVVGPSIKASLEASRLAGDFVGIEQLHAIQRYLCGSWQWKRFSLGGAVIVGLGVIAYLENSGHLVFNSDIFSWELMQAIGMLVFVCVMEMWIWVERLRTKISL